MNRSALGQWSRRRFLTTSVAAGGALALGVTGCGAAEEADDGDGTTLTFWDHHSALQDLHKQLLADWSEKSGNQVKFTYYQPKKLAEAIQLAKQSGQMPDIQSKSPSLGIPVSALVEDDWFQPLDLPQEAIDRLPEDALVEGLHTLGGKIYAFPVFDSRWHSASLFANKPVLEKAGLDPENLPGSWDEFRAACRAIRSKIGGQTYGYMDTEPGAAKWGSLAQAAGFEGDWDGQLFRTGEYALDSDPWVNLVEFLLSLQKDGLLYPGSNTTMEAPVARGRWAAGSAGFYFDGPWGPGIVAQDFSQFADDLVPGQVLTSEPGGERRLHTGPAGGAFFISAGSKQTAAANELLARFTTKEYYLGLSKSMDQPPLDSSVVAEAEGVHPNYKQIIEWFRKQVFFQPVPLVRNPEVAKVEAERKPVDPNFRSVATGFFSGDVSNPRKALKQLSDRLNQELDRAIKAAKDKGAQVSRDDYAFPDWQPGADYANK